MFERRKKLADLVGPKSFEDLSYSVEAIATHYPNSIRVYIPNNSIPKLLAGAEAFKRAEDKEKKLKVRGIMSEEDMERSLRRSKRKVRDYILCNAFELFATFTFSPKKTDRYDPGLCKAKMSVWLKNQQKRNGKFQYLIIPEHHKDGALHFHAALKNYTGQLIPSISAKTGKQIRQNGRLVFEFPGYTLGHTNVKKIKNTPGSYGKLANYLTKYVTKEMPQFFGKNRYWASNDLVRPVIEYNPPKWYLKYKPAWSHESDFGTTMIFNKEDLA